MARSRLRKGFTNSASLRLGSFDWRWRRDIGTYRATLGVIQSQLISDGCRRLKRSHDCGFRLSAAAKDPKDDLSFLALFEGELRLGSC